MRLRLRRAVDAVSNDYDAVLVAVGHEQYKKLDFTYFRTITSGDKPILMDIKAMYAKPENNGWVYWRL